MRLIMMGTGPFAVPTFRSLIESEHEVVTLVTRPAVVTQTHGKAKTAPNPMREVAESHQIEVLSPDSINTDEARRQIADRRPDLLVVCDYGQILAAETLSLAPLGGINLHGSLLPKYRGAAPVNWAIFRGETETGVTVLHMTPRLDAGPCLVQRTTRIGEDETAAELEPRLARLGVPAVHEALTMVRQWDGQSPLGVRQDKTQATKAPRLKKGDGEIDWWRSAADIYRQFRALQPWPGVFTSWIRSKQPVRLILHEIRPETLEPGGKGRPGEILATDQQRLLVGTSRGTIAIHRLQPAGGRVLTATEFLRGHPLDVGHAFVTLSSS